MTGGRINRSCYGNTYCTIGAFYWYMVARHFIALETYCSGNLIETFHFKACTHDKGLGLGVGCPYSHSPGA